MKNVILVSIAAASLFLSSCSNGGKSENIAENVAAAGEYAAGVNEMLSNEALDQAAMQAMSSSNTN